MIYLAIGAAALALLLWVGRGKPIFKRREWRLLSAAFALAAFAGAALVGMRGGWAASAVLLILGLWLSVSARTGGGGGQARGRAARERLSEEEARSILGVGPEAGRDEIQAAYTRLMRMAHPDQGGTHGLASQLNAARDRLLKR